MSRRFTPLLAILTILVFLAPALAHAQGLLIVTDPDQSIRLPRPIIIYPPPGPIPSPRPIPSPPPPPPVTYKIDELDVQARLIDQVAQVQVSQTFENTGSRQLEVAFVFPLPYEGAIDQMTLLIDGKEYPAKLMDAKEARKLYEDTVRKNKDPALLEWMGTGLFKTNVFPVPPGEKRTVSMRYSQLCRKQEGLTDFLFPLSTAKYTSHVVSKVNIRATIESQDEIKNVYSPTHAVDITRTDSKHATLTYTLKNDIPSTDFRLFYDVGKGKVSTKVLSYKSDKAKDKDEEGFFLLLTSPEIKSPDSELAPKTVVFVVDRSGSMSGKKIEQVRNAAKDLLGKLRTGDTFNIIAYDSQVEAFRPELQRYNEDTRKAAMGFIEGIYAGGSTNIDEALRTALKQLQDSSRPNYVLFLTDGLPTVGETNEMKILADSKEYNKVHARIIAFGVGFDVNSKLLDRIARENFGQCEYVRPDEDIEARVALVHNRLEAPVLSDVKLEFSFDEKRTEEGPVVNRVYPKAPFDLFSGEQLVVVGRYKKPGAAKVYVTGKIAGKEQKFDFPADFVSRSSDDKNSFIEKLWAIRRVGEILDEIDLKGKNNELVKELVSLATRHGILTPYTSFLADERSNIRDLAANTTTAGGRVDALKMEAGEGGFVQREMSQGFRLAQQAPAAALPSMGASGGAGMGGGGGRGARGGGGAPGGGFGGGGMGMAAGGMGGPGGAPSAGTLASADYGFSAAKKSINFADKAADEAAKSVQTVRNIGDRTFFLRNGQWIDSLVTKEQQSEAKRVKQFSDEYFELAAKYGRNMSQYLVFDEPVVVSVDDRTYLIEP
jgi:Ca-activated chloride channel homolog